MEWKTEIHQYLGFDQLEAVQEDRRQWVKANPEKGFMLIAEPLPTFTHGVSAKPEDCLWDSETLLNEKVECVPVSRGGQWTYHGPGQIVIYPLIQLSAAGYPNRGVKEYVSDLRNSVVRYLKSIDIIVETPDSKPFGIYHEGRKLVSMGIHIRDGISSHGIALYHSGDQTSYFKGIRACGVTNESFVTLTELGVEHSWLDCASQLAEELKRGFQLRKNC